jgi:hypothetical protein
MFRKNTALAVLCLAVICLAALFTAGCAVNFTPLEAGNEQSTDKVLIAGQSSEFKENVINYVTEELVAEGYYIKIIGLIRERV